MRLIDPIAVDGEVIKGCWVLAYWDPHANMGVFYLIGGSESTLSESAASEYLSTGVLPSVSPPE